MWGSGRYGYRRLRRALALPPRDLLLGLEAFGYLAIARLLLVLPFARAMQVLGLKAGPASDLAWYAAGPDESADDELRRIGIALLRAASIAPFRAVCLQQAVAANLMLRRRRQYSEIHFGVAKGQQGDVTAHAWACSAGHVVTGLAGIAGHTPIATFRG